MDWAVIQIGAREHYSIPRALNQLKRRVLLITDVWVKPSQRRFFPNVWKSRWHEDLAQVQVRSWNAKAALFEAKHKILRSGMWDRCIARNQWFGKCAASSLLKTLRTSETPPIVFAYSYAAREIFEFAKAHGCPCILGQIDPGPSEVRLVGELARRYQVANIEEPPQHYWTEWTRECELADRIVVNSAWAAELLNTDLTFAKQNSNKVRVVPLAFENSEQVDPTDKSSADVSSLDGYPQKFSEERPLRILFLGQVILRKGIKELAQAIRLLANEPVSWTIIGTGSADLLAELSNCPKTRVLGGVSRQSVAEWYKSSDVFILPTHSDGYAITQLEAAAYGLPIIASRNCGEVVDDNVNGLLLREVSATGIALAVRQLLLCPQTLNAMRAAQLTRQQKTLVDLQANLAALEAEITGLAVPLPREQRDTSAC